MEAEDNSNPGNLEMNREDTVEPVSMYCATTLRITLCARSDSDNSDDVAAFGSFWLMRLMYERLTNRSTALVLDKSCGNWVTVVRERRVPN